MEQHPEKESHLRNKYYLLSPTQDCNPVNYLRSYQLVKEKHNIYVLTKLRMFSQALKILMKSTGKISCIRGGAPQSKAKHQPRPCEFRINLLSTAVSLTTSSSSLQH